MRKHEILVKDMPRAEIIDENHMVEKLTPHIRKNGFIIRSQAEKILGVGCKRLLPKMVKMGILQSQMKLVRMDKNTALTAIYTLK